MEREHPFSRIDLPAKGFDRIPREVRGKFAFRKSFATDRGHTHMLEFFEVPDKAIQRSTLRADIRKWFEDTHEGHVSILAGMGIVWVTIWSKRDAALFKVFYL